VSKRNLTETILSSEWKKKLQAPWGQTYGRCCTRHLTSL